MEHRTWDDIPRDEAIRLVEQIAHSGRPADEIVAEVMTLCHPGRLSYNPYATPPALTVPHGYSRFLVQIMPPDDAS